MGPVRGFGGRRVPGRGARCRRVAERRNERWDRRRRRCDGRSCGGRRARRRRDRPPGSTARWPTARRQRPPACASRRASPAIRLLAPQSGSVVTSARPVFRWTGVAGPYLFRVCADWACETVLQGRRPPTPRRRCRSSSDPATGSGGEGHRSLAVRVDVALGVSRPPPIPGLRAYRQHLRRRLQRLQRRRLSGRRRRQARPLVYLGGPDGLATRPCPAQHAELASTPMGLLEPQTDVNGDGFTDVGNTVRPGPGCWRLLRPRPIWRQRPACRPLDAPSMPRSPAGVRSASATSTVTGSAISSCSCATARPSDASPPRSRDRLAGLRCGTCQLQQLATGDFDGDGRPTSSSPTPATSASTWATPTARPDSHRRGERAVGRRLQLRRLLRSGRPRIGRPDRCAPTKVARTGCHRRCRRLLNRRSSFWWATSTATVTGTPSGRRAARTAARSPTVALAAGARRRRGRCPWTRRSSCTGLSASCESGRRERR